jgi:hypothetical protein
MDGPQLENEKKKIKKHLLRELRQVDVDFRPSE